MAKTTTKKKATKKTASSGKVVAGKKKFTLSRNEIIIFSVAAILAIGLGGFLGYQKYQENQSGAAGCTSSTYRYGSSGRCVRYIQTMLNTVSAAYGGASYSFGANSQGYQIPKWQLGVDGSYGANTRSKVYEYQKWDHLSQDGVVGPKTWNALCGITWHIWYKFTSYNSSYTASTRQAGINAYNSAGCTAKIY